MLPLVVARSTRWGLTLAARDSFYAITQGLIDGVEAVSGRGDDATTTNILPEGEASLTESGDGGRRLEVDAGCVESGDGEIG